ncbi:MAG: hypothetical protein PHI86_05700, partial [Candidatus Omnitrophica bacterium]|nr:hypothetical protein [Candidatus Omnitrophota bacterium]
IGEDTKQILNYKPVHAALREALGRQFNIKEEVRRLVLRNEEAREQIRLNRVILWVDVVPGGRQEVQDIMLSFMAREIIFMLSAQNVNTARKLFERVKKWADYLPCPGISLMGMLDTEEMSPRLEAFYQTELGGEFKAFVEEKISADFKNPPMPQEVLTWEEARREKWFAKRMAKQRAQERTQEVEIEELLDRLDEEDLDSVETEEDSADELDFESGVRVDNEAYCLFIPLGITLSGSRQRLPSFDERVSAANELLRQEELDEAFNATMEALEYLRDVEEPLVVYTKEGIKTAKDILSAYIRQYSVKYPHRVALPRYVRDLRNLLSLYSHLRDVSGLAGRIKEIYPIPRNIEQVKTFSEIVGLLHDGRRRQVEFKRLIESNPNGKWVTGSIVMKLAKSMAGGDLLGLRQEAFRKRQSFLGNAFINGLIIYYTRVSKDTGKTAIIYMLEDLGLIARTKSIFEIESIEELAALRKQGAINQIPWKLICEKNPRGIDIAKAVVSRMIDEEKDELGDDFSRLNDDHFKKQREWLGEAVYGLLNCYDNLYAEEIRLSGNGRISFLLDNLGIVKAKKTFANVRSVEELNQLLNENPDQEIYWDVLIEINPSGKSIVLDLLNREAQEEGISDIRDLNTGSRDGHFRKPRVFLANRSLGGLVKHFESVRKSRPDALGKNILVLMLEELGEISSIPSLWTAKSLFEVRQLLRTRRIKRIYWEELLKYNPYAYRIFEQAIASLPGVTLGADNLFVGIDSNSLKLKLEELEYQSIGRLEFHWKSYAAASGNSTYDYLGLMHIFAVLEENSWSIWDAARQLEMDAAELSRLLREYRIDVSKEISGLRIKQILYVIITRGGNVLAASQDLGFAAKYNTTILKAMLESIVPSESDYPELQDRYISLDRRLTVLEAIKALVLVSIVEGCKWDLKQASIVLGIHRSSLEAKLFDIFGPARSRPQSFGHLLSSRNIIRILGTLRARLPIELGGRVIFRKIGEDTYLVDANDSNNWLKFSKKDGSVYIEVPKYKQYRSLTERLLFRQQHIVDLITNYVLDEFADRVLENAYRLPRKQAVMAYLREMDNSFLPTRKEYQLLGRYIRIPAFYVSEHQPVRIYKERGSYVRYFAFEDTSDPSNFVIFVRKGDGVYLIGEGPKNEDVLVRGVAVSARKIFLRPYGLLPFGEFDRKIHRPRLERISVLGGSEGITVGPIEVRWFWTDKFDVERRAGLSRRDSEWARDVVTVKNPQTKETITTITRVAYDEITIDGIADETGRLVPVKSDYANISTIVWDKELRRFASQELRNNFSETQTGASGSNSRQVQYDFDDVSGKIVRRDYRSPDESARRPNAFCVIPIGAVPIVGFILLAWYVAKLNQNKILSSSLKSRAPNLYALADCLLNPQNLFRKFKNILSLALQESQSRNINLIKISAFAGLIIFVIFYRYFDVLPFSVFLAASVPAVNIPKSPADDLASIEAKAERYIKEAERTFGQEMPENLRDLIYRIEKGLGHLRSNVSSAQQVYRELLNRGAFSHRACSKDEIRLKERLRTFHSMCRAARILINTLTVGIDDAKEARARKAKQLVVAMAEPSDLAAGAPKSINIGNSLSRWMVLAAALGLILHFTGALSHWWALRETNLLLFNVISASFFTAVFDFISEYFFVKEKVYPKLRFACEMMIGAIAGLIFSLMQDNVIEAYFPNQRTNIVSNHNILR